MKAHKANQMPLEVESASAGQTREILKLLGNCQMSKKLAQAIIDDSAEKVLGYPRDISARISKFYKEVFGVELEHEMVAGLNERDCITVPFSAKVTLRDSIKSWIDLGLLSAQKPEKSRGLGFDEMEKYSGYYLDEKSDYFGVSSTRDTGVSTSGYTKMNKRYLVKHSSTLREELIMHRYAYWLGNFRYKEGLSTRYPQFACIGSIVDNKIPVIGWRTDLAGLRVMYIDFEDFSNKDCYLLNFFNRIDFLP